MNNWQKIKNNPEILPTFLMREKVIDGIRSFFKNQSFHEVETPLLVKHPGTEPFLEVFETTLKTTDQRMTKTNQATHSQRAFLLTSPEYAMKKLVAAGLGNIFQICKSFRNGEGLSERHNPEFTILEWYRVNADYRDIMNDFEQLIIYLMSCVKPGENKHLEKGNWQTSHETAKSSPQKYRLMYQGKNYDLSPPFPRLSVFEAFKKYAGINQKDDLLSRDALMKIAREKNYEVTENSTWEELYNQLFLNEIEPRLAELSTPIILYDYPASQAALSLKKQDDPRFAERFELSLAGLELGNAFSELTHAEEQKERFEQELAERKSMGKTEYGLDHDYIEALRSGLPPTGGIAVGVDRLIMLFADTDSIENVTFFPSGEVF